MPVKDYYEILGIRPAASVQEIELAYKGRRSQYHPDKYATLDRETVAWATSNMQQINEAFAVLSDAIRRQAYDASHKNRASDNFQQDRNKSEFHRHTSTDSRRNTASDSGKQSAKTTLSLKDYVRLCGLTMISSSRIFFAPDIPKNKLEGAMARYGHGLDWSDVVVLIDDTIFGGAKEGGLITQYEMKIQEKGAPTTRIEYDQIQSLCSSDNALFVNESQKVAQFVLQTQQELRYVVSVVNDYLANSRRTPPSTGCTEHGRLSPRVIEEICRRHGYVSEGGKRTNFSMGASIEPDMMRTVRFSLSIPEDEQVIAICNLALHTPYGHEAFVVTSLGLYSKCQETTVFIPWNSLQSMSISGEFTQSVYCGVVFTSQKKIICSRLRVDNQTFGMALISDIISAMQMENNGNH